MLAFLFLVERGWFSDFFPETPRFGPKTEINFRPFPLYTPLPPFPIIRQARSIKTGSDKGREKHSTSKHSDKATFQPWLAKHRDAKSVLPETSTSLCTASSFSRVSIGNDAKTWTEFGYPVRLGWLFDSHIELRYRERDFSYPHERWVSWRNINKLNSLSLYGQTSSPTARPLRPRRTIKVGGNAVLS
jgi:hypothetical protein